ncbi:MAG: SEC-C domain-containing protein, partial [Coxiellaceae bacterium]|nr:SEC-C domain-containing protein [Coxiellaceae bacterium]
DQMEEEWDLAGLEQVLAGEFNLRQPVKKWFEDDNHFTIDMLRERVLKEVKTLYQQKEQNLGPMVMRTLEKTIMLRSLDLHWKEHLAAMDHMRQSIGLRGYAQKNPVQEYKREAFLMFTNLLDIHYRDVIGTLLTIEISGEDPLATMRGTPQKNPYASDNLNMQHISLGQMADVDEAEYAEQDDTAVATFVRKDRKVGRNEPCPCGSGKKYKVCHGKIG